MKVRVLLFASVREAFGRPELEVELPEAASVADAVRVLGGHSPRGVLDASLSAAVNHTVVPKTTRLRAGDTVALLPPFSGG